MTRCNLALSISAMRADLEALGCSSYQRLGLIRLREAYECLGRNPDLAGHYLDVARHMLSCARGFDRIQKLQLRA
jgi:hypothetical protein